MRAEARRRWLGGLALALLVGAGCARTPRAFPPPLTEAQRATLGAVAVVAAGMAPTVDVAPPTSGKGAGAAKGAGIGALLAIGGGARSGHPLGLAVGIALAPVFAAGGAVYGAVAAESATAVIDANAALQRVAADPAIHAALGDAVCQVAQAETRHQVICPAPAEAHLDAVLRVALTRIGLAGNGINPPLAMVVAVEVTVRRGDGTVLFELPLQYMSGTRTFVGWAARDAAPLREELHRAFQALAERIVEEVFLLYVIPPTEGPPA